MQCKNLLHHVAHIPRARLDRNLAYVRIMSHPGVCIVHQEASNQPGLLDTECLSQAGYTVRVSRNCVPDLIISRAGTTAAFLLVNCQNAFYDGSGIWDR